MEKITREILEQRFSKERKLRKIDLESLNLKEIVLQNGSITHANFKKADLSGACFENMLFVNSSFSNARMHGAKLRNVTLVNVNMENIILTDCEFDAVKIIQADLYKARFDNSRIVNSSILFSNVINSSSCELELKNSDILFSNLSGSNFKNAKIIDNNLRDSEFIKANFGNSVLSGNLIEGSNFKSSKGIEYEKEKEYKERGAKVSFHALKWMNALPVYLKILLIIFVIFITSYISWYFLDPINRTPDRILKIADEKRSKKKVKEAIHLLERAKNKGKFEQSSKEQKVQLIRNLAHLYSDLKQNDKALEILGSFKGKKEELGDSYVFLMCDFAKQYADAKKLDKADDVLETLLKEYSGKDDKKLYILKTMGTIYKESGQADKALAVYKNILKDYSYSPNEIVDASRARAQIMRSLNLPDSAIVILEKLKTSIPAEDVFLMPVLWDLGDTYKQNKIFDRAQGVYEEIINTHKGNIDTEIRALKSLVFIFESSGKEDLAQKTLKDLIDLSREKGSEDLSQLIELANLQWNKGDKEEAVKVLQNLSKTISKRDNLRIRVDLTLASYLVDTGNEDKGLKIAYNLLENYKKEPESVSEVINFLSNKLSDLKKLDELENLLTQGLEIFSDKFENQSNIATRLSDLYWQTGRKDRAVEFLRNYFKEKDRDKFQNISLCLSLFNKLKETNQRESALEWINLLISDYEKKKDVDPLKYVNLFYEKANILKELSKYSQAEELLIEIKNKYKIDKICRNNIEMNLQEIRWQRGEKQEALKNLEEYFDSVKDDPEAGIQIGFRLTDCNNDIGNPDRALAILSYLLNVNSQQNETKIRIFDKMSQVYWGHKDFKKALEINEEITVLSPKDSDQNLVASLNIAKLTWNMGDRLKALGLVLDLKKIIDARERPFMDCYWTATEYLKELKRSQEAIGILDELKTKFKDRNEIVKEILQRKSRIFQDSGQNQEMAEIEKEILSLFPADSRQSFNSHLVLTQLLWDSGEKEKAIDSLRIYLKKYETEARSNWEGYWKLGRWLTGEGKSAQALAFYDSLKAFAENDLGKFRELTNMKCEVLKHDEKYSQAISLYLTLLDRSGGKISQNLQLIQEIAECYKRQGDFKNASVFLNDALEDIKLDWDRAKELTWALAQIYYQDNKNNENYDLLRKFIRESEANGKFELRFYVKLFETLKQLGKEDEGISNLEKVLKDRELTPQEKNEVYSILFAHYRNGGDFSIAESYLQGMKENAPGSKEILSYVFRNSAQMKWDAQKRDEAIAIMETGLRELEGMNNIKEFRAEQDMFGGLLNFYLQSGRPDDARKLLDNMVVRGIVKGVDELRAFEQIMQNIISQKDFVKAEDLNAQKLKQHQDDPTWQAQTGKIKAAILWQKQMHPEAISVLSVLIDSGTAQNMYDLSIYWDLAHFHMQDNKYDDAISVYQKLILLVKDNKDKNPLSEAISGIANCYFQEKKYNEALTKYNEAISICLAEKYFPRYADLIRNKAALYWACRDSNQTINLLENEIYKPVDLRVDLISFMTELSYYYALKKDTVKLANLFTLAESKAAGDKNNRLNILKSERQVYRSLKNFDKALAVNRKIMDEYVKDNHVLEEAYRTHAEMYREMGNEQEAQKYFKKIGVH